MNLTNCMVVFLQKGYAFIVRELLSNFVHLFLTYPICHVFKSVNTMYYLMDDIVTRNELVFNR